MRAGKKKYSIGFLIHDGCLRNDSLELFFPEIQNYYCHKAMAQKSQFYDIFIITSEGQVLSKNLRNRLKNVTVNDLNLDFLFYNDNDCYLDVFTLYAVWVPQSFTTWIPFQRITECFLKSCTYANLIPNYSNIEHINTVEPRYLELLKPEDDLYLYTHNSYKENIEPKKDFSQIKLFYIAMSDPLQRHGGLISLLDKTDFCAFYGPKRKWLGIKSYVSSLPFGDKIFSVVNDCGVYLGIHNPIHSWYEFFTNRVLEAAQSGAILITNDFSNLKQLFQNSIFTLDLTLPDQEVFRKINEIMNWIQKNPIEARKMAVQFQKKFTDLYLKEDYLLKLCEGVVKQKEVYKSRLLNIADNDIIDIFYAHQDENLVVIDQIIIQIKNQHYHNLNFVLVCKPSLIDNFNKRLTYAFYGTSIRFKVKSSLTEKRSIGQNNTGSMFLEAIKYFEGNFFTFIDINSKWHKDHLLRLLWEIKNPNDQLECVYSDTYYDYNGKCIGLNIVPCNEHYEKQALVHPMSVYDIISFTLLHNIIDRQGWPSFTDYEGRTERRFLKGVQLFNKNVLTMLSNDLKAKINSLDGSEHLFFLVLLVMNEKYHSIKYTKYNSFGLYVKEVPSHIKGVKSKIRYSMYPNAPLISTPYFRAVPSMAGQLYRTLFSYDQLWKLSTQYITISHNILDDERIEFYLQEQPVSKQSASINQLNRLYRIIKRILFFPKKKVLQKIKQYLLET